MLFRQFTCGILHSNESKFKLEETNLVLPCIKHTTWTHYRVWKRNRITITTTTVFEALSYKVRCCCYIYAWRRPCQGRRFILSRWCVVVVVLCCVFFFASFLLIPFLCCANAIAVFVCMLLDWLVFVLWSHCNIEESKSSVRINSLIPLKMHLVYIGSKQQQSLCMRMCMFFLVCWLMLECRSMHHGERREIQRFYDITSHRQ